MSPTERWWSLERRTRMEPGSSSTDCLAATGQPHSGRPASSPRRADAQGGVCGWAVRCPVSGARLPDAADRRDLRPHLPARSRQQPRRAGRQGGPLAQPEDVSRRTRDHRRHRNTRRLSARHARVPRPIAGRDPDRAAARPPSRRRRYCAARIVRPAGTVRQRAARRRDRAGPADGRRDRRAHLRRGALLPPPGPGGFCRDRPQPPRRGADPRRKRGESLHPGRGAMRRPGDHLGDGVGLGARPRRVRSDIDVRRIVPRDHADRPPGDLRPIQQRLHLGARTLRGACARLRSTPPLREAARTLRCPRRWSDMSGLEVSARDRLREIELDVDLRVNGRGRAAIVGPSGAGKSTLLRIIAGLRSPDPGRVVVNEQVWLDSQRGINLRPEDRACGLMFQDYALFPHLSASRNVAFGLTGDRATRRRRALEQLARFGVERLADARPHALSGGERQRVALARALAREPSVLLLDEPLSALDTRTRTHAGRELATALNGAGALAIVVTHDFSEAALLADEIFVMDEGRIVQRGTAAELSARPASAFVADFAGSVVLNGTARPGAGGLTEVELEDGGAVNSTDVLTGPVAALVFPWEISLEPAGAPHESSALNRLEVEVVSVTEIGNRVRVGLAAPQPLVAEVTAESVRALAVVAGARISATWKATATRLVER